MNEHAMLEQILERLTAVERLLRVCLKLEVIDMAIGDDILAKVKEADGKVDSVVAFIKALQAQGTIPADVATAILTTISGSEAKLDAAIGPAVPATP